MPEDIDFEDFLNIFASDNFEKLPAWVLADQ